MLTNIPTANTVDDEVNTHEPEVHNDGETLTGNVGEAKWKELQEEQAG